MKIFLDTANLEEIREAAALGVVDGVTTNPSLVAKEGVDFHTRLKEICQVVKGPVSAEVVIAAVGAPPALRQALELAAQYATVNFFAGTYPPTTLALDPNLIHYKQIRLTGSHDFSPHHFETALRFIEMGTVRVADVISHRLPLARVKEGFDVVAGQKGLKVVITVEW